MHIRLDSDLWWERCHLHTYSNPIAVLIILKTDQWSKGVLILKLVEGMCGVKDHHFTLVKLKKYNHFSKPPNMAPIHSKRSHFRPSIRAAHPYQNESWAPPVSYIDFATPPSGHGCIKEYLECQNKSGNQRHPAKVLNSDFHFCPRSKSHLQNCLIHSKDFLTHTAQGRRHIIS